MEWITQEEFEPVIHPDPKSTMALPDLDHTLAAQLPEKKMIQKGLWGGQIITNPTLTLAAKLPEKRMIQKGLWKGKTITKLSKGKKDRNMKAPKKKAKETKHTSIPKVKDDCCEESVQLARYLDLQDKLNYIKANKKK